LRRFVSFTDNQPSVSSEEFRLAVSYCGLYGLAVDRDADHRFDLSAAENSKLSGNRIFAISNTQVVS
jgi:hypothetical protein